MKAREIQRIPTSHNMTADRKTADSASMTLSGHLRELRNRLLVCLAVLTVCVVALIAIAPKLITALTDLGTAYNYVFVYIAPQELLLVCLNIALVGGLVLTFPVIVYQIYAFCSPGLKPSERRIIRLALLGGTLCFLLGAAFARYISLPFMLRFLIQFTADVDVSASISINQYVSFILTVFLIFGLVFELPVVSVILTALGFIRTKWLVKGRKVMIVVIFFIAAVITPPDVVSQIMVALPMCLLYQVSIVLSRFVESRKNNKEQSSETAE